MAHEQAAAATSPDPPPASAGEGRPAAATTGQFPIVVPGPQATDLHRHARHKTTRRSKAPRHRVET